MQTPRLFILNIPHFCLGDCKYTFESRNKSSQCLGYLLLNQRGMSGIYQQLCNLFIKPARQNYSDHDLGPIALGSHGVRQNFALSSHQGHELKASFFRTRNRSTDTCVLYLHSFNGSRLQSLRYASEVLQAGFHFCSFDFAGCGNSGGEYVSLGCNQRWDVLKVIQQVKLRFGVTHFFIWGRSMGAVAAVKFYQLLSEEQSASRHQDLTILGLVLDSAFISLKRMVVEVAQSKISIPGLLVKAVFMMVSSSIQERAGFKVDQLQLASDVEAIRCSTLLVASKEDSFVNYTHSEEIFSRLKLHDNKQIEYTRGQHYESRDIKTLASIYSFFQKKHRKYTDLIQKMACLTNSRINGQAQHIQDFSLQKHTKSLRKYEPKLTPSDKRPQQLKMIHQTDKKLSQASKIVLFRSIVEQKEIKCQQSPEYRTIGSDKKIPLKNSEQIDRQYQTQKKIEESHIKLGAACKQEKHKNGLRNKSKPNFVCKIQEICNSHRIEDGLQKELSKSTQRTQEQIDSQENHCNIIADKLKKKSKNQRERIIEFKDRNDIDEFPLRVTESQQFRMIQIQTNQESIKIRPKVNFTIGLQPTTPVNVNQCEKSTKKLSMTAQQYKNSQIKTKGVVTLSPNIRRRGEKGSCTDLKARIGQELKESEQTKSMNNLITLGGNDPLNCRNINSILNISVKKQP